MNFKRTVLLSLAKFGGQSSFQLKIDGRPLPQKWFGADANKMIDFSKLYELIDTKSYQEHTLEIIFEKPGVEVYTFTFG